MGHAPRETTSCNRSQGNQALFLTFEISINDIAMDKSIEKGKNTDEDVFVSRPTTLVDSQDMLLGVKVRLQVIRRLLLV